jgi:hypothetical protein
VRFYGLTLALASLTSSISGSEDAGAQAPETCCYMPQRTWSTNGEADQRNRAFVTSILILMGEENLRETMSRTDETYRCLYLPSSDHSTLVRADRHGQTWDLTTKQLSGTGDYAMGDLIRSWKRRASIREAGAIRRTVSSLRLDGLARPDGAHPGYLHADVLALESIVSGRYHIRFEEFPNQRQSGADLRQACWQLLCTTGHLSGESELLRALLGRREHCSPESTHD